ncbi:MAG TPA: hypothetical protein VFS59_16320 [Gemmatimonadaceae bacterium]|nr:hypothetical protein [Gemmatimonadaceae bacterium]
MRPIVLVFLALGLATRASAQQTDSLSQPHAEFMERAYIFKNVPDGKTGEWFEGLVPLHIPFRQNVQGVYDKVLKGERRSHATTAGFGSVIVNLRQTRENSAPVRTPSYMPKLTFTYFNARRDDSLTLPRAAPKSVRLWIVPFVPYGHYSNGQDGCLFTFQVETGDVCADTSSVARDTVDAMVNRRDGSFSSHYVQLGVFYRKVALDPNLPEGPYLVARSYWSLGAQVRAYQPYYWLGGGMSKELRQQYGPTRVRILANRVRQHATGRFFGPGQLRVEGWAEGILGSLNDEVSRVRLSLEVARTMDKRSGWGLFARGYSGQDDYNLGFMRQITVIQVGATASGERMPSFRL